MRHSLGHWHGYFYEREGVHWSDESMTTIVSDPGDGEQDISGKAWSCRRRFNVNGSWSKGENDIIQVEFKMSSFETAYADPFCFNGRFDPERDALTGVWGMSGPETSSSVGPMEFRRIPPHYLTAYPTIKDLTDDKPRALWKFAIAAVRNDIRRESWSWSYFSQRRDDRNTILSMAIRYYNFGTPLSAEEFDRMVTTTKRLTSADACFYESRSNYIRVHTWVHT
jgi:Vacuolar sorting-associated protein 13, N-terminal